MGKSSRRYIEQVSRAYSELVELHPELQTLKQRMAPESGDARVSRRATDIRGMVVESVPTIQEPEVERHVEELVILTEGRPSMLIRNDDYDLSLYESLPNIFHQLLEDNRDTVSRAIGAVGRIEVWNHPRRAWIGTGFIADAGDGQNVLITNRHVADEMAYRRDDGSFQFVESMLGDSPISASLDLKEEVAFDGSDTPYAVPIREVLNIEPSDGFDLAFLLLGEIPATLGVEPLKLDNSSGNGDRAVPVAAIGYPSKDTRETSLEIVLNLLGDIYNKKRLAPGVVKTFEDGRLTHDCSTLGGNSGSPLINLESGRVVGVHYGGTFPNAKNVAVPIERVQERLHHALATRSGNGIHTIPREIGENSKQSVPGAGTGATSGDITTGTTLVRTNAGGVSVEIPLRLTLELGQPNLGGLPLQGGNQSGNANVAGNHQIEQLVKDARQRLGSLPGVVTVRSGVEIANGRYTSRSALVVLIDHNNPGARDTITNLPAAYGGLPVQARAATPSDLAAAGEVDGSVVIEKVHRINYEMPPDLSLDPVDEEMFAVFHVSPDAGWSELQEFLSRTDRNLTIALYNFSAPHIKAVLRAAVAQDQNTLNLVLGDASLDRPHPDTFEKEFIEEFVEVMGERFQYELADGKRRLFAGHYHTKVAVRDSEAVWLSSGNWEDSNQPDLDPLNDGDIGWEIYGHGNREWHAVLLNDQLANTFESYIKYDLNSYRKLRTGITEAPPMPNVPLFLVPTSTRLELPPVGDPEFFAPLTVNKRLHIQPLMTPDNYLAHVTRLVESATESIDLQNQALKWRHENVDPRYERFMQTVLNKHRNGVRVRFIMRSDYPNSMKELLIQHGFDAEQIRMQSRCHTKGMIVDSQKTLLGSHNLTEWGALINRDASLIVDDDEVAGYFSKIFQYDWNRASIMAEETPPGIRVHRRGDPVPDGYEVVSLADVAI